MICEGCLITILNKKSLIHRPSCSSKMVDLHSLPSGSRPVEAVRNNGPDHLLLDRMKLRELAEGWPMYR